MWSLIFNHSMQSIKQIFKWPNNTEKVSRRSEWTFDPLFLLNDKSILKHRQRKRNESKQRRINCTEFQTQIKWMRITSVLIGIGLVFWVKIYIEAPNEKKTTARWKSIKWSQTTATTTLKFICIPYTCVHLYVCLCKCVCSRFQELLLFFVLLAFRILCDCVSVCVFFFVNGNQPRSTPLHYVVFYIYRKNVINFHVTWINGLCAKRWANKPIKIRLTNEFYVKSSQKHYKNVV